VSEPEAVTRARRISPGPHPQSAKTTRSLVHETREEGVDGAAPVDAQNAPTSRLENPPRTRVSHTAHTQHFSCQKKRKITDKNGVTSTVQIYAVSGERRHVSDGVVHDEGGTFTGTVAIERWNAAARAKYHHTVAPISSTVRDGATIVVGRVAGDFPNSPIELDHIFRLEGDKIASLEIR
jgi:hypothetical protein